MIWSEQELANIAIGGAAAAVEQVMKHLDEPVNVSLFKPENFSLLWGVLGVAGLNGASPQAREEIWEALKKSGVLDAYDKGILGDFNRKLIEKYGDNRLRGWGKPDNFAVGEKFKKTILRELLKTNKKLESETLSYCIDGVKLVSGLVKSALEPRLKAYLERLRGRLAAGNEVSEGLTDAYEKETVLRRLSDVIVYAKRAFSEEEKNYFYYYLAEAVADGFDVQRIGVDDRVLARLMADEALDGLSELEANPLLQRNADIAAFAESFEERDGFFEETAAKLIRHDKMRIGAMVARCLKLAEVQPQPRGVVFALELINLGQVKSAVKILIELAKKGQATETACLLHRLLPHAKGAETLIMDILKHNLERLRADDIYIGNSALREYTVRLYLQAGRSFAEVGQFKESAGLLLALVNGGWFADLTEPVKDFAGLANLLLQADTTLADNLCAAAKRLQLKVFSEGGKYFVGRPEDNPLTQARHRLEQTIMGATTLDLSRFSGKISKVEASTYGVYENIKEALTFGRGKNAAEPEMKGEAAEVVETAERPEVEPAGVVEAAERPEVEPVTEGVLAESAAEVAEVETAERPEVEPVAEVAAEVAEVAAEVEAAGVVEVAERPEVEPVTEGVLAESAAGVAWAEGVSFEPAEVTEVVEAVEVVEAAERPEVEPAAEVAAETVEVEPAEVVEAAEGPEVESAAEVAEVVPKLPDIEKWEEAGAAVDETSVENAATPKDAKFGKLAAFKDKVNINSILKIKSEEVDKHFEKIRQVAGEAIKRAEVQAAKVKQKVEDTNITQSSSVGKIREIAKKIRFFKKK